MTVNLTPHGQKLVEAQILPLARAHKISAYDAANLELAIREGLPLATLEDDPRRAACATGVAPVGAG